MKYYIVSRWRNKDKVLELTDKLRAKGKKVYCFLECPANLHSIEKVRSKDYDPEKAMQDFEAIENWKENKYIKGVFRHAMKEIKESDVFS